MFPVGCNLFKGCFIVMGPYGGRTVFDEFIICLVYLKIFQLTLELKLNQGIVCI